MRIGSRLIVPIVLMIASQASAQPSVPEQPQLTQPPSFRPAGLGDEPKITLISAGAVEGRRELRSKPAVGFTQSGIMDMKMTMATKIEETKMPAMEMPGTRMPFDITVESVDPDGAIHYKMKFGTATTFDDDDVNPMVTAGMRAGLQVINGLTGSITVSDRLITRDATFEFSDQPPAMMKMLDSISDSSRNISAPLPAEAVGVGASWRVVQHPIANGIRTMCDATYTIEAMDADVITLRVALKLSAERQLLTVPGAEPETKFHLNSMQGVGEGLMKLALGSVLTHDATISSTSTLAIETVADDVSQKMTQDIAMKMRLYAPPPDAPAEPAAETKPSADPEAK